VRILVTGSTGYLGRATVARLAHEGHEVVALSRRPATVEGADAVRIGDVLLPETLAAACEGCEAMVHAAGVVSHHPDDAKRCFDVHVRGTENALDAAAAAGIRRVVYVSTSGTIAVDAAGAERPLDERAPAPMRYIRAWPYYRSKLFAEELALARSGPEMEIVCLNPALLLGPGDPTGESTRSVRLFMEDQVPAAPPGGICFVDVRDAAEAVALALTRGRAGRRYLLGAANMSFAAFYQRLARITDRGAPPKMPKATRRVLSWLPELGREEGFGFGVAITRWELELACHSWYVDSRRAREELGWRPRDPGATLSDTVEDILARRSW